MGALTKMRFMTKYVLISFIFCSFVFASCRQRKEVAFCGVPAINVPLDRTDNPALFDSLFRFSHYIVLETNDKSLIRHIGKIVFAGDDIYVLDDRENKILVFDGNGKYIRQHSHLGQGPGEYLSLRDFQVKGDTLFLLDRLGAKLLAYGTNDSLLQVKEVEKAKGFYLFGNGSYALNMELGSADGGPGKQFYSYVYCDGEKPVVRGGAYNKELCGLSFSQDEGANSFYLYNDSLFTFFPYNDTIYCVDREKGRLLPYMSVLIGDERITMEDGKARIKELKEKGIVNSIFSFYKWDNRILFSYYYKKENRKYVLADDAGNVLFKGAFTLDKDKLPVRVVPYDGNSNQKLLSLINSTVLLSLAEKYGEKSRTLKDISEKVTEEGNPVLVFYDFLNR